MPYDSSNFGYRTLPVWLQDFVAGLGPSTMANLRQGFQQEIVRPGVRINFDREFANRNSSLSEVLSQVFTQPGNNALVPGRIFNPINQGQPSDPSIPPFLPIRPDLPTSPPPPSGGSGGSGSGGSGGSGSGSGPTSFCSGSGPFSSICDPACLDVNGDGTCGPALPPMGSLDPFNTGNCASVRFDTSTTPPTAVLLCGCSYWEIETNYFSWDGFDCFNIAPYANSVLATRMGFCCYENLGVLGHATVHTKVDPDANFVEYIQYQVVGEPTPLTVAEFLKQLIESYCPNGDCSADIPGWVSCNAPWEVLYATGRRSCPTPVIYLPPYNAFP